VSARPEAAAVNLPQRRSSDGRRAQGLKEVRYGRTQLRFNHGVGFGRTEGRHLVLQL
jgi:hypothetical protein